MNGVSFSLKKYMNGSCFSLSLVYEWGRVRGLQPHIRTQYHGKLPPVRDINVKTGGSCIILSDAIQNTVFSLAKIRDNTTKIYFLSTDNVFLPS